MILYGSNYFGLPQLRKFNGSAVYRTVLPSLLSTAMVLVYKFSFGKGLNAQEVKPEYDDAWLILHPFVITIYVMAYSLIINHRLNYCYQRYWESCSNIFMMTSKWIDSATTLASFHYQSVVYDKDRPRSFGDEDKPVDKLKDTDKHKSSPTGGNTRIDHNYVHHSDDDAAIRSMSSSPVSLGGVDEMTLAAAQVAASDSYRSNSRTSFVSQDSRQRLRKFSDSENFERAKIPPSASRTERIDANDSTDERNLPNRQSLLMRMISWKSNPSIKHRPQRFKPSVAGTNRSALKGNQSESSLMKVLEKEDQPSTQSDQRSGSLTKSASMQPIVSTGPKKSHVFHKARSYADIFKDDIRFKTGTSAEEFGAVGRAWDGSSRKRKSMSKRRSITGHGINRSKSTGGDEEKSKSRHRRLPSTDIPTPGIDGQVKSFKPNPSLSWQKQNSIAIPRYTGLHSTPIDPAIGYDFELMLLKEEKERKEKARKKQMEQQQNIGSLRRGASFFRRPTVALGKIESGGSLESNDFAIKSEPRSQSYLTGLQSAEDSAEDRKIARHKSETSLERSKTSISGNEKTTNVTDLFPRLTVCDLPSIHTTKMDKASQKTNRGTGINTEAHNSKSDSPTPVPKMNGRASLFLQEAAHLFSLMSAVAMASLRADMEGVSSPLVDYVPGQKFPPVNPEEMQVKIFIEEHDSDYDDHSQSDSVIANEHEPTLHDEMTRVSSEITFGIQRQKQPKRRMNTVRIQRNNNYLNVLMFLFGLSRDSRQRTIYNASRPFSVLGGISDAEVEMLRKVRGHAAQHALCSMWLREFITREHLEGSTGNVAPPIVARVYQYISDGAAQYNNCRKTAFTDFPFPHAQLTSFFGFVSIFVFPLLFYTHVNNSIIAMVLNFFTMSCFLGIEEVALELEQPFIRYPNDLPLNNYQAQFNEALISTLYTGFHPDAWGEAEDNEDL